MSEQKDSVHLTGASGVCTVPGGAPKPQAGTWLLIAPDGRSWSAESPLRCVSAEQSERVPAEVAMQRIIDAANERSLFERAAEALAAYMAAMRADWTDDKESVIARIRAADKLAQPVYAELYAIVNPEGAHSLTTNTGSTALGGASLGLVERLRNGGQLDLAAMAEALVADAERYRWLADNMAYVAVHPYHHDLPKSKRTGWTIRLVCGDDSSFDAAVDSARSAIPSPLPSALD